MGNIEKTSVKYLILLMASISVAGIILWPILDLLYHNLITHSDFVYSAFDYILEPIFFGCIIGLVFWLTGRRKAK